MEIEGQLSADNKTISGKTTTGILGNKYDGLNLVKTDVKSTKEYIKGEWYGTRYDNKDDRNFIRLLINKIEDDGSAEAEYHFSSCPDSSNISPTGIYKMKGVYISACGKLLLSPTEWFFQPEGYTAIDFTADFRLSDIDHLFGTDNTYLQKYYGDTSDGFDLTKTGYCIINNEEGFGYNGLFSYEIPYERYKEVYGSRFTEQIYKQKKEKWNGNCFGMSASSVLFSYNMLKLHEYMDIGSPDDKKTLTKDGYTAKKGNVKNVRLTLEKDNELTKLIERYNIWQDSNEFMAYKYSVLSELYKGGENGKMVKDYAQYFQKTLEEINTPAWPYIVYLVWEMDGKQVAHAMVTDSHKKPYEWGNGWYRVYLYDPNNPYYALEEGEPSDEYKLSQDRFIDLNVETGEWRCVAVENGDSQYTRVIGCNDKDNVIFLDPRGFPTVFDGTASFTSDDEETISYSGNDVRITDFEGNTLFEIKEGKFLTISPLVKQHITAEYMKDGAGVLSGVLQLKKGDYIVEIDNGMVSFSSDGDYIGVVSDEAVRIENLNSTTLKIAGLKADKANVVIEDNENEKFTCIGLDIPINSNESRISLNGDQLSIDNVKGNLSISVTNDTEAYDLENVDALKINNVHLNDISEYIDIYENELKLKVGESYLLSVEYKISSPDSDKALWKSNNTSVAIVDDNGKITAISPGKAQITVTRNGKSDKCIVTVDKSTDDLQNKDQSDVKDTNKSQDSSSVEEKHSKKISKVKLYSVKAKKKALVVKWRKIDDVKGYEVQYALNKKFTKNKKKKRIKSANKTAFTIKKLKNGNTYFIRVRAYELNSDGKIVYGKWSKVKKIRIKK